MAQGREALRARRSLLKPQIPHLNLRAMDGLWQRKVEATAALRKHENDNAGASLFGPPAATSWQRFRSLFLSYVPTVLAHQSPGHHSGASRNLTDSSHSTLLSIDVPQDLKMYSETFQGPFVTPQPGEEWASWEKAYLAFLGKDYADLARYAEDEKEYTDRLDAVVNHYITQTGTTRERQYVARMLGCQFRGDDAETFPYSLDNRQPSAAVVADTSAEKSSSRAQRGPSGKRCRQVPLARRSRLFWRARSSSQASLARRSSRPSQRADSRWWKRRRRCSAVRRCFSSRCG